MRPRPFTPTVLAFFVAGIVSVTAGEIGHGSMGTDPADRAGHSSCPDSGDEGSSCDPTCPCTCCPGHSAGIAFMPVPCSLRPLPSFELPLPSLDALRPQDVQRRIFHPPRA